MHFEKWHGIGNDFIVIQESVLARQIGSEGGYVGTWDDGTARLAAEVVVAACDRQFGIGADGILVIGPSQLAQARMQIYNADGSMASMCGNGIRVVARALVETDSVRAGHDGSFDIETAGGIMRPTVFDDGRVRVDMGELITEGLDTIEVDGEQLHGRVVNVGNPHFAVERGVDGPDLHRLGPRAEHHVRFPDRTNVEFYEVVDAPAGIVRMRVWERGVGETLACGTGACAVAFSARADAGLGDRISVQLPGGELEVELDAERAFMTGPAHHVFNGELDPARLVAGMRAATSTATR